MQSENNDARLLAMYQGADLTEIEVVRDHDSALGNRFGENLSVRQALQALVTQMSGVIPLIAQPTRQPDIYTGINKKLQ